MGLRLLPTPLNWNPISHQQALELEKEFTEEEIWQEVKDLGSNKTPV